MPARREGIAAELGAGPDRTDTLELLVPDLSQICQNMSHQHFGRRGPECDDLVPNVRDVEPHTYRSREPENPLTGLCLACNQGALHPAHRSQPELGRIPAPPLSEKYTAPPPLAHGRPSLLRRAARRVVNALVEIAYGALYGVQWMWANSVQLAVTFCLTAFGSYWIMLMVFYVLDRGGF